MSGVLDFFKLFNQTFWTPKPFVVGRDLSRKKNLEWYVFEFADFRPFSVSLRNCNDEVPAKEKWKSYKDHYSKLSFRTLRFAFAGLFWNPNGSFECFLSEKQHFPIRTQKYRKIRSILVSLINLLLRVPENEIWKPTMIIIRNCCFWLCVSLLLVCLGTLTGLSSFFWQKNNIFPSGVKITQIIQVQTDKIQLSWFQYCN